MPPSLYLRILPTVLSLQNGLRFILASPHPGPLPREREPVRGCRIPLSFQQGKGSLFMDAGNMLEVRALRA